MISALVFSSCESGKTARALPAFEAPIARADFQNVRTTAYTQRKSDHTQYGARNALGGELHAAGPAIHRAENVTRAIPLSDGEDVGIRRVLNSGTGLQPFSLDETTRTPRVNHDDPSDQNGIAGRNARLLWWQKAPRIGSAAADWSRWPAGTTFRLLSTGQIYRVDDYGWALSGRNTIDLYMATRGEMFNWGVRSESIQFLRWGDSQESLRFLSPASELSPPQAYGVGTGRPGARGGRQALKDVKGLQKRIAGFKATFANFHPAVEPTVVLN